MASAEAQASVLAHHAATAAADRAGVTLVELTDLVEFAAASSLLARVWGTSVDASPIPSDLLASLAHAGSCVLGAVAEGDLVGIAVGVAGAPRSGQIYSLIAATGAEVAGRGVGAALKFGQRAWALDRGADRMIWTFDPLVRRNAHFNINKLGARAAEYRVDFYPPMHDAINRADLTDRLVADWDLVAPVSDPVEARDPVKAGEAIEVVGVDDRHHPIPRELGDDRVVSVYVPADIEQVRRTDPRLALQWRLAVRDALRKCLARGYHIVGFSLDGAYVLEQASDV